jgi:hypothetical protein
MEYHGRKLAAPMGTGSHDRRGLKPANRGHDER